MTISSTVRKSGPYPGTASADTFPFSFKVFETEDVVVIKLEDSTSIETTLALTTDYTVTLNQDQNNNPGGNITLVAGNLPVGFSITITSDVQPLQGTDLTNQGGFYPEVINDALDKAVILAQQQQSDLERSIKFSITNTIGSLEISENAAARANQALAFDAQGDFQVAQELGVFRGDWTPGVTYGIRDIVKDASNQNVYINQATHTSSGTTPLLSNPQISNWALIVDAAAAGNSANAAAASALAASNSADDADDAAGLAVSYRDSAQQAMLTAEDYRDDAEQARNDAQTAESNASGHETAAETARDQAVAAAESAAASSGGGVVKVTTNDTNANTLSDKIISGVGISVNVKNAGGDERLEINSDAIVYAIALG